MRPELHTEEGWGNRKYGHEEVHEGVKWDRLHIHDDGLINDGSRSITNFLVNSPSKTIFQKSVNTFVISKSNRELSDLLDSTIQVLG